MVGRAALLALLLPGLAAAQESSARGLRVYATTSAMYDSNIEHEPDELPAYGGAAGLGARFQVQQGRQGFELGHEFALHRYSRRGWDRLSNHTELAYWLQATGWLRVGLDGEISLQGTSEDRDLSNQYIVRGRLEFRPAERIALRLIGGYRLRRVPDDPGSNAYNPALGIQLRQRLGSGGELILGWRGERTVTDDPANEYRRATLSLTASTRGEARDALEWSLGYRVQRYPFRALDDDPRQRRRDIRVSPALLYTHRFAPGSIVRIGYEFEARGSNDSAKEYVDHVLVFSMTQDF
jgi:hypothetical protein